MQSAPAVPAPGAKWKRVFRFSLRALLIAVTAFGVWLGIKLHEAREQRAAVKEIRALGGWVHYDYQIAGGSFVPQGQPWPPQWLLSIFGEDFFQDVVEVNMVYNDDGPKRLDNNLVSDEVKRYLPGLPQLTSLALKEGQATDDCLRTIASLSRLEEIYMWDAPAVTDAGAAPLRNLAHLKFIHLSGAQLTDESLRTFGGMLQLEGLTLQNNHFTDQGLAHLTNLHRLKSLWVDKTTIGSSRSEPRHGGGHTPISDQGIERLSGLKNLEELGIQGTDVTESGVERLKAAIPGLKSIFFDAGPNNLKVYDDGLPQQPQ